MSKSEPRLQSNRTQRGNARRRALRLEGLRFNRVCASNALITAVAPSRSSARETQAVALRRDIRATRLTYGDQCQLSSASIGAVSSAASVSSQLRTNKKQMK